MKLKLKTLTPVHVSTGKDLEPFDYIESNGYIYRISLEKALKVISEEVPDAPEQFSDWIDERILKHDTRKNTRNRQANREQSDLRKKTNFAEFCKVHLGNASLVDRLLESAVVYKVPLPFGLQDNSQINEQIKTSDYAPYIPGSSIKGAVRTALAANAWRELTDTERAEIATNPGRPISEENAKSYYDEKDKELMKLLFSCDANGEAKSDAARFSILKFFHFSDAHLIPSEKSEVMETIPVFLYLKGKKPQTQTNAQEMIAMNVIFEFDLTIDTPGLLMAFKESKKERGIWRDLEKKLERLLDVKLGDIQDDLENKLIEALFVVLKRHAKTTFEKDAEWLDSTDRMNQQTGMNPNTFKRIKRLYDSGIPNYGGTLRVGWGSGFLSTTIFHALKEKNATFLTAMFEDSGIATGSQKKRTPPDLENFPKSRRMTAKDIFFPQSVIGWIQVAEDFKEPKEEMMEVYAAENQKKPRRGIQEMNAIVLRSLTPDIFCEIIGPDFPGEYKTKYFIGLPEGTIVTVNANFNNKGIIQNISRPIVIK